MHIKVMTSHPEIHGGPTGTTVTLNANSVCARLLRILVLAGSSGATTTALAREIGKRSGGVKPGTVPSYVQRLRKEFGDPKRAGNYTYVIDCDVAGEHGYALQLAPSDTVDLFVLDKLCRELGDRSVAFANLAPGDGNDVEELDAALKGAAVNPGSETSDIKGVVTWHWTYDRLISELRRAVGFSYVRRWVDSGDPLDANIALAHLESQIDGEGTDDEIWKILLRVEAALPTRARALMARRRQIEKACGGELPDEIAELLARLENRDPEVLLRPAETPSAIVDADGVQIVALTPTERGNLAEVAAKLGISTNAAARLRGSRVDPSECIDATVSKLWFAGILGGKWVLDPDVLRKFETLLDRLDTGEDADDVVGCPVRLLVIDPRCRPYKDLKRRGTVTSKDENSLPILARLVKEHPSFAVKMYDAAPTFRMIIVDGTFVTVSPYLNLTAEFIPEQGWEVPQLVLTPIAQFPLANSFEALFLDMWKRAEPISSLNLSS